MESEERSLSLPVRIVGIAIASLLVLPAIFGVLAAASSGSARGALGALGFIVFFGGIVVVLVLVRRHSDAERQHDRQWGPRPRPPG